MNFLVKTMQFNFVSKKLNSCLMKSTFVVSFICSYTFDFDCFPGEMLNFWYKCWFAWFSENRFLEKFQNRMQPLKRAIKLHHINHANHVPPIKLQFHYILVTHINRWNIQKWWKIPCNYRHLFDKFCHIFLFFTCHFFRLVFKLQHVSPFMQHISS